jgi:4-hydroxybutyrate dehydrogenase
MSINAVIALQLPRTLFARGAITLLPDELEALGARRPLLVTDAGVSRAGLAQRVVAAIGDYAAVAVFDAVTENPVFANADEGVAAYRRGECDAVIGLGGGSVIDTAKCIALLAANPGTIADYALKSDAAVGAAAPVIAIPTTAGTGSEADLHAGIHPDSASASVGVMSRHLLPRVAILDPELTVSLPPRLTAATGVDALTHCIEGYLSRNELPFAKPIALDGVGRATRAIRRAVADGSDIEARGEMMLAAYAGGVAIGMGLGSGHALALTFSDQGFQHGMLSGIGLVASLDHMAARQPERAAVLADAMGVAKGTSLGGTLAALMGELGLPATLAELGYRVADRAALAQAAHESFCNLSAWHHPSVEDYDAMIARSLTTLAA